MRAVALIAADNDASGDATLRAGDRGAVQWGVALAGTGFTAQHRPGDIAAEAYAVAAGAATAIWSDGATIGADLILIGPGAIDCWGDELTGRLADGQSAELVFDVLQLERDGDVWRVVCDAGRGARDVLRIAGALVVVLSEQVPRPPYVSSFRRARAARALRAPEVEARSETEWKPVAPRRQRVTANSNAQADDRANSAFGISGGAATERGRQTVSGSPAVCAEVLLRYLVHHGFVDRRLRDRAMRGSAVAGTEHPAATPGRGAPTIDGAVSPAAFRGPRVSGEGAGRRARRPRPAANAAGRPNAAALRRGPRRVGEGLAVGGRRGPYRLISGPAHSSH